MKRALLAVALLVVPTLVFAQAETTGRVTGTVMDENHQPIKGADITIESPAMQGQRKSTSDENGRFLVSLLPGGVYTMTVNAPGKSPLQYTFRVGVGQSVPIEAVLKAGNMAENVTVFAPAAKMETTAGGENFNLDTTIRQLPLPNGGDYLGRITNLAPNVSDVTFTANTLSISGAPSFDNSVLLDGADISDPFYSGGTAVYLEEAVEEVQVITNGASARYGRFQGGVVNATTKSGGNTFDGSIRADFSKQTWNQKSPFHENQSDDLSSIYSGTFGGPIMKDHLWFFLGGRTIPETSLTHSFAPAPNAPPGSVTQLNNEHRYQGKLTGAISANHTVDVSYLRFQGEAQHYDPLGAVESSAVIDKREDPRKYVTAEYHGVLNDKTFLGVQYAQKTVSIRAGGDPNGLSPIMEYFDGEYHQYANGWWDPNDPSVRDNKSAAINMTHSLATGTWGDHTLEYGIQYVDSITAGDNRQSATGFNLYYVTNIGTPDSFADCTGGNCVFDFDPTLWQAKRLKAIPGAGKQDMKNLAVYVQDGWEFRNWRVDLGLRWEQWKGDAISPAMTLDFNDVSPRIGVTYNITPEWQLQGTWGKYIARFNDGVANGVTGISSIFGPGILQEYSGPVLVDQTEAQVDALLRDDTNWGTILGFVDPQQPTTFFSKDIKGPYANDLNLSIKRALPKNSGVFTLTYSKRQFKDLLESYKGDRGQITVTAPVGGPGGTPQTVDVVIWDNCDTCQRDYEAITAGLDYRPSAKWNLGGNYTYSKLQGNYEGEAASQPAIGSIIGDYTRNVDPGQAYPYGYLNGDIRHRARLWGDYRFDFGRAGRLTVGGIAYYRSGANFSKRAGVAAGDDPAPDYSGAPASYTRYFDGRGNNRFDGFWNLDTTIRYDISFWRDLGMMVKFDIVNITNNDAMISYRTGGSADPADTNPPNPGDPPIIQQFLPSGTFGTPSSERNFQAPRSYRVSVGINF